MSTVKNSSENSATLKALKKRDMVPLIKESFMLSSRFVLVVTGSSMRPTLKHLKDKVELVPLSNRAVKKGDIILFEREGEDCILHRVIKVCDDNTFIVNGDAQTWTEKVAYKQIIAVVSHIYKNDKRISCDNILYRLYCSLWRILKPLRPLLIKIKRTLL